MAPPKGYRPLNGKYERNQEIIEAILAGCRPVDVAEAYGISRQFVGQIWKRAGGQPMKPTRVNHVKEPV